jgi:Fe-Mn family superoxide dismutase
MRLHHTKHHQGYVDKLNAALEQEAGQKERSLVELLTDLDSVPASIRTTVRNQGGGHYNHSLFWQCMTPQGGGEPVGSVAQKIIEKWGNVDAFTKEFNQAAVSLFGSGWVWLTRDFEIIPLPNQDTPMALGKGEPLMGLDVWEHAYYLDYKNKRDDYIATWWNVVDWQFIENRYTQ